MEMSEVMKRRGASAIKPQGGSADESLKENMRCFSVYTHRHVCFHL